MDRFYHAKGLPGDPRSRSVQIVNLSAVTIVGMLPGSDSLIVTPGPTTGFWRALRERSALDGADDCGGRQSFRLRLDKD
jgi:hypothetical protein